jgi:hypothetical protein
VRTPHISATRTRARNVSHGTQAHGQADEGADAGCVDQLHSALSSDKCGPNVWLLANGQWAQHAFHSSWVVATGMVTLVQPREPSHELIERRGEAGKFAEPCSRCQSRDV